MRIFFWPLKLMRFSWVYEKLSLIGIGSMLLNLVANWFLIKNPDIMAVNMFSFMILVGFLLVGNISRVLKHEHVELNIRYPYLGFDKDTRYRFISRIWYTFVTVFTTIIFVIAWTTLASIIILQSG
jgi:hypothetical protein